jgi:hypothetical protein
MTVMFGEATGLRKAAAVGLILLMAVGSVALWLGIPFAWVYGASQVADSSQPSLGPYVMVIVGIPASMVLMGKLLSKLNRLYGRITQTAPTIPVQLPWMRAATGERNPHYPMSVLDVVMVVSVTVVLIGVAVWFFFLAGSPLPRT